MTGIMALAESSGINFDRTAVDVQAQVSAVGVWHIGITGGGVATADNDGTMADPGSDITLASRRRIHVAGMTGVRVRANYKSDVVFDTDPVIGVIGFWLDQNNQIIECEQLVNNNGQIGATLSQAADDIVLQGYGKTAIHADHVFDCVGAMVIVPYVRTALTVSAGNVDDVSLQVELIN